MNWNDFLEKIYEKCNRLLSTEEISQLLDISKYEKDNPISQGKKLIIKKIEIKGEKITGEKIDYFKKFDTGVNVIFADNGKGKSSLFKIIKFALTGDKSSIKKDVYSWLEKIKFEFELNSAIYTIYIDLTGSRIKSGLYRSTIDSLKFNTDGTIQVEEIQRIFEENSELAFKENMQRFFFNQFSYYNLSWTSSSKKKLELTENNTSWKTYYKSIYLESKDYNVLFLDAEYGLQNKKVLEMILGLKYTALINSWSTQRDHFKNTLNKEKMIKTEQDEKNPKVRKDLIEQFEKVNEQIKMLQKQQKKTFSKTLDIDRYSSQSIKLFDKEKAINSLNIQLEGLEDNKWQIEKRINNLKEELDFGFYFSNLDVKKCPRCEHDIEQEKEINEKENHKCKLCEGDLDPREENEEEMLTSKIDSLDEDHIKILEWIERLKNQIHQLNEEKELLLLDLSNDEDQIHSYQFDEEQINELSNLIENRLEIEHLIEREKFVGANNGIEVLESNIKAIEYAIALLNELRYKESNDILTSLSTLICNQLIKFGLKDITKVKIKENLEILFIQNEIENKFNELNEGEQLRAKIAVVLSLILLDVKYSVGRHPRLLIIDSPGKEEVISKDLISLSKIFKEIEDEYKNELQIIIGTALEELKNASIKEKIDSKGSGETVF